MVIGQRLHERLTIRYNLPGISCGPIVINAADHDALGIAMQVKSLNVLAIHL